MRLQLPAIDILLIARTSAVQTPAATLREDLSILWAKLAALKARAANGTMRG